MKIGLASVFVSDQEKAVRFYTEVLGFLRKADTPVGAYRWLTVVSAENPDGVQLLLEPNNNPVAKTYQDGLHASGIPATTFFVTDLKAECDRLTGLGVVFTVPPTTSEYGTFAILDDTCGNLIALHQG